MPLPLVDVVVVGAGDSPTAPGGGIPSGFCCCDDRCVGGKFTGFVLPVPGVWIGNDTGAVLPVPGAADGSPTGPYIGVNSLLGWAGGVVRLLSDEISDETSSSEEVVVEGGLLFRLPAPVV